MSSFRLERVAELLREVISEVFLELKDPRVGFATITNVKVSPDIKYAKVFVSILGSQNDQDETMKGLNNARGFIRREISKRIRLRHIPEISFIFDESIEKGSEILQLISKVIKDDEGKDKEKGQLN